MNIIDGKAVSAAVKDEVKEQVTALKKDGGVPCLAVVLVGDDPASKVYVRNKNTRLRVLRYKIS